MTPEQEKQYHEKAVSLGMTDDELTLALQKKLLAGEIEMP